jgi:site-specific DNA-methyltransferase (adenine-specific)
MRAIVRDYSRPNDLVVDPFSGGGTTCLSARMEGRRTIGIDSMAEHAILTARRVSGATETETQGALFG